MKSNHLREILTIFRLNNKENSKLEMLKLKISKLNTKEKKKKQSAKLTNSSITKSMNILNSSS